MKPILNTLAAVSAVLLLVFACEKPVEKQYDFSSDHKDTTTTVDPVDTSSVDPVDTTVVETVDTNIVDPVDTTIVEPIDTTGGDDPQLWVPSDILDIYFGPDGGAWNAVDGGPSVKTVPGSSMCTYYNTDFSCYAAHFNVYPAGGSISSGYFKVDYTNLPAIKNKISDGHSLEMILRLDCTSDGSREIKAMCSQQAGGTGIMVSASGQGTNLTFLPNVSPSGSSNWCWAKSGVKPIKGRYYHIVGVWDKDAGKARVYINGELKNSVDAKGNFNFATNGATWFCVGGDAQSASAAESGWWGDIVVARVYDEVLSDERVADLWNHVPELPSDNFVLTDVNFQAAMNIAPGYKFNVFAGGLQSGDYIRLVDNRGESVKVESIVDSDKISGVIPSDFSSGEYTILVVRGMKVYPVGRAVFNVSSEVSGVGSVKCVAHRGYHPDNAHPENSIAALKYAQQLGVYGSEFDVWKTTDGGLFINHDGVLSGVTISSSTTAAVENLTLANGEKIPTLRQYLEEGKKVPSVKMILELKHYAATDGSVELVKELQMEDQVEWIAFDYNACKRVRQLLPGAVVQYLNGDKAPSTMVADGISAIDYSYSALNSHPEWIKEAHDNSMFVNVWTVDSDFASWIAKGVDVITTNQAKTLMESLTRVYVEK